MKNGTIAEQLQMQERELNALKQDFAGEKKKIVDVQTDENVKTFSDTSIQQQISTSVNQPTSNSVGQSSDGDALSSLFSILPSATDVNSAKTQEKEKAKAKIKLIIFHFTSDKQRYIPEIKRQHQALRFFTGNLHIYATLWVVFPIKVLPYLFPTWGRCLPDIKRKKYVYLY